MRIYTPLILLAGCFQATRASWLEIISINFDSRGVFHDDGGAITGCNCGFIDRDFNDGCSQRNIPDITELCMDWGLRRGHLFTNTGARICYSQTDQAWIRGNGPDQGQGAIWYYQWNEVACTWPAKRALINETETAEKRGIEEGIPELYERKKEPRLPSLNSKMPYAERRGGEQEVYP